jgi:hypothetical protein
MAHQHPSVRDVVEYGLDRISPDRTVSVPLRDLVRVLKSFEGLNAFFHQPTHYPHIDAIHDFLGSRTNGGAYQVISEALYDTLPRLLPDDILRAIEAGAFEHPEPLAYRGA